MTAAQLKRELASQRAQLTMLRNQLRLVTRERDRMRDRLELLGVWEDFSKEGKT